MAAKKPETKPDDDQRAFAAAQVHRTVAVRGKDGKPTGEFKRVAIGGDEVLSFKDYGTHTVVVTTDGQKFSSADEKAA